VADIFIVPYSGGKGGTAVALPGASSATMNEYYPAWSPDDTLVAFNAVPVNHSMYNTPEANVYVVPYNGGQGAAQPTPLVSNNAPACQGLAAGTLQNTWPKWAPNPIPPDGGAPAPQVIDGVTYYWITFSSTRSPSAQGHQQLYVAGITVDGNNNNQITTYAPIYLWNQSDAVNNLIPAWGTFKIPPGVTPPPTPPTMPTQTSR
jgi:hypothetical protein